MARDRSALETVRARRVDSAPDGFAYSFGVPQPAEPDTDPAVVATRRRLAEVLEEARTVRAAADSALGQGAFGEYARAKQREQELPAELKAAWTEALMAESDFLAAERERYGVTAIELYRRAAAELWEQVQAGQQELAELRLAIEGMANRRQAIAQDHGDIRRRVDRLIRPPVRERPPKAFTDPPEPDPDPLGDLLRLIDPQGALQ